MENNSLQHHGVIGMKWGVRRYQTKDGSLTPAGKRRYQKDMDKLQKERAKLMTKQKNAAAAKRAQSNVEKLRRENEARRKKLEEGREESRISKKFTASKPKAAPSTKPKTRSVKDMSDEELQAAVNRARLEQQYLSTLPAPKVSKGRQFANTLMKDVVTPALKETGKRVASTYMEKELKKMLGLNETNPDEALKKKADRLGNQMKIAAAEDFFEKRKNNK